MAHRIIAATVVSALVISLAVGIAVWKYWPQDFGEVLPVKALSAIDMSDDRALVGFADNVFFGRVTSEPQKSTIYPWPSVVFNVEVLETLKENASGIVKINQAGGFTEDGSAVYVEGDPALLESNKTYIFAMRHDPENDWHVLSESYQYVKLNVSDDASKSDILDSDEAQTLRDRFNEAIEDQIVYSP